MKINTLSLLLMLLLMLMGGCAEFAVGFVDGYTSAKNPHLDYCQRVGCIGDAAFTGGGNYPSPVFVTDFGGGFTSYSSGGNSVMFIKH